MRPPNFFLVGASKSGTTSLYNYLAQHPQIYMSPIKEPNFFADEVRSENFSDELQSKIRHWEGELKTYLNGPRTERFPSGPVSDWQDYLKLFAPAGPHAARGEASPCYLWSKTAPANIAARCPDARIVMILRNPIERAFAQHLHTLSAVSRPLTFREHIEAALQPNQRKIGELYPFLEFGMYGEQVERYLRTFPRDRILILFYEDFTTNPRTVLQTIFGFLAVDQTFAPDLSARHMTARVPRSFFVIRLLKRTGIWAAGGRLVPVTSRRKMFSVLFRRRATMRPDAREIVRLRDFYRSDIERLSELIGIDLSRWLQ